MNSRNWYNDPSSTLSLAPQSNTGFVNSNKLQHTASHNVTPRSTSNARRPNPVIPVFSGIVSPPEPEVCRPWKDNLTDNK